MDKDTTAGSFIIDIFKKEYKSDFETLKRKGSLDYVYIIANEDFTEFCAIHFEGLTIEDFRPVSPGARGKVQMYKHRGMKKASVLIGNSVNLKEKSILAQQKKKDYHYKIFQDQKSKWEKTKQSLRSTQIYDSNLLDDQILRAKEKYTSIVNNIDERIKITQTKNGRYSFEFEPMEKTK